jgi:PAS domain S-box-containing protein
VGFHPGIIPRHTVRMNAAIPFRSQELFAGEIAGISFRAIFERAPIAVARCNSQGVIVEMNPAFERTLDRSVAGRQCLRLRELVPPQERDNTDALLRDLLESRRESIGIEARGAGHGQEITHWTAWRQPGYGGEPDHALLLVQQNRDEIAVEESLVQSQKWETVGRMTGGVVHDFNNLLTGVMLYCDLLLSSLDSRDCRRRYADEIRSAIIQAASVVRQLLAFARPFATAARELDLNAVATATQDLLSRLIGENISLDLKLDPELGTVNIDPAQAQQILLNLVLNARDALPEGGRITVETSNCKFQPLAQAVAQAMAKETTGANPPISLAAFPCVLLTVADNGHGINAEALQRIFEPFFTTKNAAKGTGLGLTTVRSIVSANGGLIHVESEPGQGTRVMIVLPRASHHAAPELTDIPHPHSGPSSATPFQENKKESQL